MRQRYLSITAGISIFFLIACFSSIGAAPKKNELPHLPWPFDPVKAKLLQLDTAEAVQMPVAFTNSIGMKFVLIPAGNFEMGPNGSKYRVQLAKFYYIGATEVTMGQYRKWKKDHRVEKADDAFNEDDRPVAMVNWHEARAFCARLSESADEKQAGRVYALPTEAQWEWAARAGSATSRYFGESDKGQEEYSWFNVTYTPNPKNESDGRGRQPVGKLKPNAWGLYDMLGNVWEWCVDVRVDEATGEKRDPAMRGGSWRSGAFHCTAVAHDPGDPAQRGDNIGFRVVCQVEKSK